MTLEELKVEASKLGYHLVKDQKTVRLLPCPVCGSKRTIEWIRMGEERGYKRECERCEFEADWGTTKKEARENWNKKVEVYFMRLHYANKE